MSNIIFDSNWEAISTWTWNDLVNHQYKDFALVRYELETEIEAQGIQVEFGKTSMATTASMSVKGIVVESLTAPLAYQAFTDMSVAIFVSDRDFYSMMMYHLPWYDKINLTFQHLLRVFDTEFRYLEEQIGRVERNLFLDTAIEKLEDFELHLGIKTNRNLSYNQRRNQIQAKLHAMHEQTTTKLIKKVCSAFSDNESGVDVFPTKTEGLFEIRFNQNGLPNNWEELEKTLEIMFPADEAWKFTFTQDTWDDKKDVRWMDMETVTWDKFNEYGGVKD